MISREYKPGKVKKQFSGVKKLIREEARTPRLENATSCKLIAQYNPLLPNIKAIIRIHLPILHSNQKMLDDFPQNTEKCHMQKKL